MVIIADLATTAANDEDKSKVTVVMGNDKALNKSTSGTVIDD